MAQAPQKRTKKTLVDVFAARPRLVWAFLAGAVVFAALRLWTELDWFLAGVIAWNAMCLAFALLVLRFIFANNDPASIRAKAATQDEGQAVILGLAVVAGLASIAAVGVELAHLGMQHGVDKGLRVALALLTVALSWTFVQFIFALHYAHEYYGPRALSHRPEGHGLDFPGGEAPDYWDFVHFSVVIGVACQTADIAFTSKPLRRIGGVHGILAFVFNTGIVALSVGLLAGLFGPGGA